MLRSLAIRGLAVIEHLDLDLQPGMNVFSGETGAGKSILVDAIGLALGDRTARGNLIRSNCNRAEITLAFDIENQPKVQAWLTEHDFDHDDCLLRRVLTHSATRAYINDTPTSLKMLRALGEQLIEIHGQHEHQRLLRRDQQRLLLDQACKHAKALARLAEYYRQWQEARLRYETLSAHSAEHEQALALLAFQVEELEALGVHKGEYEELDQSQHRLASADELRTLCGELVEQLYEQEEHALCARLAGAASQLQEAIRMDPALAPVAELLQQALMQVEEATAALRSELARVDVDPETLQEAEQRLTAVHDLARKHQVPPAQLWQKTETLKEQLQRWQSPEFDATKLADTVRQLEQEYRALAKQIHDQRCKTAKQIAGLTTTTLHKLGMKHSAFTIEVQMDDDATAGPHGLDRIEYQISTAPDQRPGPIAQIASGGELSRLSLALQQSLHSDLPAVMIFDEIDAGIGGGPAEIVGQLLAQLADQAQVLCVTHLPQVAVQGQSHYCVRKHDGTRTEIVVLDVKGRVEEIARMFSGVKQTRTAREHAQALLRQQAPSNTN